MATQTVKVTDTVSAKHSLSFLIKYDAKMLRSEKKIFRVVDHVNTDISLRGSLHESRIEFQSRTTLRIRSMFT